MHVHLPKQLHGLREVLGEIAIIVVGVLIALAAEALVDRHRIAESVAFSREDFVDELQRNRAEVATNLRDARALDQQLASVIREGAAFVEGRGRMGKGHQLGRSFVALRSAAWSSALSTQVMGHFPHEEGHAIAQAYNDQAAFLSLQQSEQAVWFALAEQSFLGEPTKADVAAAIKHVVVAAAYLRAHEESEEELLKSYDAALSRLKHQRGVAG